MTWRERYRLRRLLSRADRMRLGIVSFVPYGHGWRCFAANCPLPHVAEGPTGPDALEELLRFCRRIGL